MRLDHDIASFPGVEEGLGTRLDHDIAPFPGVEEGLETRLDHNTASSKSNTCSISYPTPLLNTIP